MKRVVFAVVLATAPLAPAGPLGRQALPGNPVTIYVAVERPLPAPETPPSGRRPPAITPRLVAPWRLETGLQREDFEVISDSTPVSIAACVPVPRPVWIVLVVDVSASVGTFPRSAWLKDSRDGPFVRAVEEGDRVAIGRVGGAGLRFSPDFNGEKGAFMSAARDVLRPTERDPARPFGLDGSPIWDAVDRAVDMLGPAPGRRAVVLLSDGQATANVHSFADVAIRAVTSGVSVSVVSSARDSTIRQTETTVARIRSRVLLERLASDTGGTYIQAFGPPGNPWLRDEDTLNDWLRCTLARAVEEVRGGYALTFSPPVNDGLVHALEVRVKRDGFKVRSPVGYRAARPLR